ncbi:MAG: hypothetical protein IJY56_04095 [Clostridia bacterium]|nr:hypothetical protein [Clostridia bacterium]
MSKRIICIALVIITLLTLCSCDKNQVYVKQDTIKLNYNNITTGGCLSITNDVVCFVKHNFGFDLYVIDTKGKHKITTLSYSYGTHVYNDKLFYYDDGISSGFEFFEYDLVTQKSKKIATISVERIYNYYVVDDVIYVEIGDNDTLVKDVVMISPDTGKQKTVANEVFACGIVEGKLNFITKKDNEYSIYGYSIESEQINLLGRFELEAEIYEEYSCYVNFNSKYITLVSKDEMNKESEIHIYKYENSSLISYNFKGAIRELIAYDKYAFLRADGKADASVSTEIIYRFNIYNLTIEKIAELSGYNELFVGSDDEVYVSSTDFDGIRRYSVDGKYEDVIIN